MFLVIHFHWSSGSVVTLYPRRWNRSRRLQRLSSSCHWSICLCFLGNLFLTSLQFQGHWLQYRLFFLCNNCPSSNFITTSSSYWNLFNIWSLCLPNWRLPYLSRIWWRSCLSCLLPNHLLKFSLHLNHCCLHLTFDPSIYPGINHPLDFCLKILWKFFSLLILSSLHILLNRIVVKFKTLDVFLIVETLLVRHKKLV